MLRKIAIALAAASLFGAASIPTDALAFGHGGGGGGRGFGGGGSAMAGSGEAAFLVASRAAVVLLAALPPPGLLVATLPLRLAPLAGVALLAVALGPGFRGHRFARFGVPGIGLGLGLGYGAYSYYNDPCYAWTPYGYTWVCGYDY